MNNTISMVNGNISNVALATFSKAYDSKSIILETADSVARFAEMAFQAGENSQLGIQLNLDYGTSSMAYFFSNEGVDVTAADYEWAFEKCQCKASIDVEDYKRDVTAGMDKMHVYRLGYKLEKEDAVEMDRYKVNSEYCGQLIEELKKMQVKIRVVMGGMDDGAGYIYIISKEELSLRIRTLFAIAFADSELKKADDKESKEKGNLALAGECMASYMVMLIQTYREFCIKGDEYQDADELPVIDDSFEDVYDEDVFADISDMDESEDFTAESEDECDSQEPVFTADTSIDELELSVRAYNCLKRAGINTIGELKAMTDDELMHVRNLGRKGIADVQEKLRKIGKLGQAKPKEKVDYMAELKELVGLEEVKAQVKKIEAFARLKQDIETKGGPAVPMVLNMEFAGNPGTAKTTVARILAGIFYNLGVVESEEIVEVGRSELIGRYVGETAVKVKKVFENAKGKVLFVDEAYSLVDSYKGSYSDEAVSTMVQEMENNRKDTVVVFAGYPEQMKEFLSMNPGLASRIPFRITFKDYSEEELYKIVELETKKRGFTLADDVYSKVIDICTVAKAAEDFGNGRYCRNLVDAAILNYASRVYGGSGNESENKEAAKDYVLRAEDFASPDGHNNDKKTNTIGFVA